MNLRSFLPPYRRQLFYLTALFGVSMMNLIVLSQDIRRIQSFKKVLPYQMIGYQFNGLDEFTKDISHIGYYTDLDIETDTAASKMFAHAQYMLAPSILDLNNTDHDYILFVCSNEKVAWQKIKEVKALPLRRNKYGMILARRLP